MVQYLCVEKDFKYTYIVIAFLSFAEEVAISDQKFFPFLTPQCCLLQIASGIKFLHDKDIQHRDIKPQNILWNFSGKDMRFVISDFDLSCFIEEGDFTQGNPKIPGLADNPRIEHA